MFQYKIRYTDTILSLRYDCTKHDLQLEASYRQRTHLLTFPLLNSNFQYWWQAKVGGVFAKKSRLRILEFRIYDFDVSVRSE